VASLRFRGVGGGLDAAIERRTADFTALPRGRTCVQKRDAHTITAIRRGGYVLEDSQDPRP